ncbi:MAG TPA: LysM peptidoglycan-binding domain-containing M23 family metallopeptidase [Myxococcota bacterium]|nr:LysM peptidoglycan-binding domain-containing M23 family metallopeptidase [Myxococcota bacterium]
MRRTAALVGALGLAWAGAIGCASRTPSERRESVVHVVERGETIAAIARQYGVSVDAIVQANQISDFSSIEVGTRLIIPRTRPGGRQESAMARLMPIPSSDLRAQARREADLEFDWPIYGRFSSPYGWRGFGHHEGIDLGATPGTPVLAAEAGRVIESGWHGDYGQVVVVKHAGNYSTLYAHNQRNRVKKGAFVEKGDVIAELGSSGNATGPHLHFEIRRDRQPEDPLRYLPPVPTDVAAPAR